MDEVVQIRKCNLNHGECRRTGLKFLRKFIFSMLFSVGNPDVFYLG